MKRSKQVGIKTLAWFDEDGLPVMRHISSLPDQDAILKAFVGCKTEILEINDNSIETVVIPEKKPASETVSIQQKTREQLLTLAAQHGVTGVDGRTSKPNIIAALRKHANAQSDEQSA
jgi:hypothetical protein